MEAIGDSWLFAILILVIVFLLLIKIIPELWRNWQNRRKTYIDLPKEGQDAIKKEYKKDVMSNLRRFLKWFFWI
jgi:hypothetical protein